MEGKKAADNNIQITTNKKQAADSIPATPSEKSQEPEASFKTEKNIQSPIENATKTSQGTPKGILKPSSNKKKVAAITGVVFVLLAALGITGYFFYQNQQLKKETPTPTTTAPTPTPAPDPTAGWKSHSYKGVTFKYPDTFKYEERVGIEGCFTLVPNTLDGEIKLSRLSIKPPEGSYGGCILTGGVDGAEAEGYENKVTLDNKMYTFQGTKFTLPDETTTIYARINDIPSKGYVIEYGGVYTEKQEQEYLSQEKIILQILSTFQFTEDNTPNSPTPTNKPTKIITYKLPSGWLTETDKDNTLSVGYDPNKYNPMSGELRIDFAYKLGCTDCTNIHFYIKAYNGGSRHEFIKKHASYNNTDRTHEIEYTIQGKSALMIYAVEYSATYSVGMINIDGENAILITSTGGQEVVEPFLQTVKLE